jgi:Uma2 family endonuclease
MAEPAKRIATYADIEALPPHVTGEIIFGTLVTHPSPAPPHGRAQSSLSYELEGPFNRGRGGPGGWIFLTEPELHLMGNVLVPDLAGWKSERLTPFPKTAWIDIAPNWLCEIILPATERYDRNEKRRIYATWGVEQMWLLDPRARVLECFTLVAGQWLLSRSFDDTEIVNAPPFEAANFPLSSLLLPAEPEPTLE